MYTNIEMISLYDDESGAATNERGSECVLVLLSRSVRSQFDMNAAESSSVLIWAEVVAVRIDSLEVSVKRPFVLL